MAQVVQHLPNKHEAVSSNSSTIKTKQNKILISSILDKELQVGFLDPLIVLFYIFLRNVHGVFKGVPGFQLRILANTHRFVLWTRCPDRY
jgi:hypothetical protein